MTICSEVVPIRIVAIKRLVAANTPGVPPYKRSSFIARNNSTKSITLNTTKDIMPPPENISI